jgi:hypothetical protein
MRKVRKLFARPETPALSGVIVISFFLGEMEQGAGFAPLRSEQDNGVWSIEGFLCSR